MVLDDTPPVVPVAVALRHDQLQHDIPVVSAHARPSLAAATSSHCTSVAFRLPGSRTDGELSTVTESQIQKLLIQGYTRGHAAILAQTIKSFPLRIWVVDNSGSMQKTDGHRFAETAESGDIKVVECSRWRELKDCVEYHARMAAALEAPTTFRMLNDPGCGPNSKQFGIAEGALDESVLQREADHAIGVMNLAQPLGVTPLLRHIEEIKQTVKELEPELREIGSRVTIILATDGLPTDDLGYGGRDVEQQFVEALRGLEGLPVWLVIRLCTDRENIVNFYNGLDKKLELSLDVIDDFLEEAKEVYKHNPWLNYALPLHRLREMGYHDRVFDLLDERRLTVDELGEFLRVLLLDNDTSVALPDPSTEW
jgi:hypothetical protein